MDMGRKMSVLTVRSNGTLSARRATTRPKKTTRPVPTTSQTRLFTKAIRIVLSVNM